MNTYRNMPYRMLTMSDRNPLTKTDASPGGRAQAVTSRAAGRPHPLCAPVKPPRFRGVRAEKLLSCSAQHGAPKGVRNNSIVFPHAIANRGIRRVGSRLVLWPVGVRLGRTFSVSYDGPVAEPSKSCKCVPAPTYPPTFAKILHCGGAATIIGGLGPGRPEYGKKSAGVPAFRILPPNTQVTGVAP